MKHLSFLSVILIFFVKVNAGATDELLNLTDNQKQSITTLVQRLNRVYSDNKLPEIKESTLFKVESKQDRLRKTEFLKIRCPDSNYEIHWIPRDNRIRSFQRLGVVSKNSIRYDTPPNPGWSEPQAITIANEFLLAALGSLPRDLGNPTAKFMSERDMPHYLDGTWDVAWPRVSKRGFPFLYDTIRVMMKEKIGAILISDNFYSNYVEGDFQPIPQEIAMKEAEVRAKEMMQWPPARMRFVDFALGASKAELKIVNPQYITEQASVEDLAFARDVNARLAWVVTYKTFYAGSREGKKGIPVDGDVQVWFDAENGKYLGGDFK